MDREDLAMLTIENMKATVNLLRVELKDALFIGYGAQMNWPKSALYALQASDAELQKVESIDEKDTR